MLHLCEVDVSSYTLRLKCHSDMATGYDVNLVYQSVLYNISCYRKILLQSIQYVLTAILDIDLSYSNSQAG